MDNLFSKGLDTTTGTQHLQLARLEQLQRSTGAPSTVESTSELTPEQRTEFAKAAKGFESMFINMMLKQMRDSMIDKEKDGDDEGGMSFGADTLQGFTDLQFADYAVEKGGFGIAQQVYAHLTGGETLALPTQHTGFSSLLPKPLSAQAPAPIPQRSEHLPPTARGNFAERVAARLQPYQDIIGRAAHAYNVPEALIKGVITAESAGNPQAQSPVGAKGLMQLMDGTARELGVRNAFDPEENIMGGTQYLGKMLRTFGGDESLALAAYNAGPGNVQKYKGVPPFSETKAYIRNVLRHAHNYRSGEVQQ